MQVLYIVCCFVFIVIFIAIDIMIKEKKKMIIVRKQVFEPINPGDLPEFARDVFQRVGDVLANHGMEAAGDLIYQSVKNQNAYLRYFKDKKGEIIGYIDLQSIRGINHAFLAFQTKLAGEKKLVSWNHHNPFYKKSPDVYRLFEYPDCMPGDLLRLHKEEVVNSGELVKRDDNPAAFSDRIAAVRLQSTELAIEEGWLIPGKNPEELRFSYAALMRQILSFFTVFFKKSPGYLKDKTFSRGFKKFINPDQGKVKKLEQTPREKQVIEAKIWWLIFFFVILYLILFVI